MSTPQHSYEQRLLQQTQEALAQGGLQGKRGRRERLRAWARRLAGR